MRVVSSSLIIRFMGRLFIALPSLCVVLEGPFLAFWALNPCPATSLQIDRGSVYQQRG